MEIFDYRRFNPDDPALLPGPTYVYPLGNSASSHLSNLSTYFLMISELAQCRVFKPPHHRSTVDKPSYFKRSILFARTWALYIVFIIFLVRLEGQIPFWIREVCPKLKSPRSRLGRYQRAPSTKHITRIQKRPRTLNFFSAHHKLSYSSLLNNVLRRIIGLKVEGWSKKRSKNAIEHSGWLVVYIYPPPVI